jgi:hypothetical protein
MLWPFFWSSSAHTDPLKRCVHIASYEADFDWTQEIEAEFRSKLQGTCNLDTFFMDTKRNPSDDWAKKKGLEAREFIEAKKPDIVFLSDDNAVKWVLLPFYKNATLPFVFVGVNWTLAPYNLPFDNTTGVIEVAPIEPMIYEVKKALPTAKSVAFLTIDTETERKEFPFVAERFKAAGFSVNEYWAKSMAEWKKQYLKAQGENDFVFMSNISGASDWNERDVGNWVLKNQLKLTAGTYQRLLPIAGFVMAKSAAEQSDIGVEQALQILHGKSPKSVLVTANKLYDFYINKALFGKTGLKLSEGLMRKAERK